MKTPKFHPSLGYQAFDAMELVRPPYYRLEAELLKQEKQRDQTIFSEVRESGGVCGVLGSPLFYSTPGRRFMAGRYKP